MTPAELWGQHRRNCWHCQREWKHWEDGDMTCQEGVDLFMAARKLEEQPDNELTLF